MPRGFHFQVVGLNHRCEKRLERQMMSLAKIKPIRAELVREPDNSVDKNAIKVVVTDNRLLVLMERKTSGIHIGYMRKEVAKVVAPGLDDGSWSNATVRIEKVNPKHHHAKAHCTFQTPARKIPATRRKIRT